MNSVIDPQIDQNSETIVYTLLYLINEPNHRQTIREYLDFPKLCAIFTDIDQPLDTKDTKKNYEINNKFEI